ncbi:MAG TPA: hypothetical protein VGO84_08220, partial [Burkholderiales bacterium]|nr:hypothetical protein [Burkholderiales bacterium]
MSDSNPYQPPSSPASLGAATPVPVPAFAAEARSVEAGRGWEWIAEGFALFKKQPGTWILI